MRACREGGAAIEQALRDLDRIFFAILYKDAMRTLRDADATRDLVQDTFIKVWRRCVTFRGESDLLPWIKVILRHGAIERLRKSVHEVPMEDHEGLTADASRRIYELSVESNPTPEELARRHEHEAQFQSGWRRFQQEDPLHASVMAWIVEEGLSNDNIAELLNRTPGRLANSFPNAASAPDGILPTGTRSHVSQARARDRQRR
jgi:RNA polymerase sigma factor (sigma-70 family)